MSSWYQDHLTVSSLRWTIYTLHEDFCWSISFPIHPTVFTDFNYSVQDPYSTPPFSILVGGATICVPKIIEVEVG